MTVPGRVLIALGANLGNATLVVTRAMNALCTWSRGVRSSLWETEPQGCPPGTPPFVNAAVALDAQPTWTPEDVLARLHELERHEGRVRSHIKNESRTLDLDLIAFGSETRDARGPSPLELPHPRAHARAFVLVPLAEVAPDFVWPGSLLPEEPCQPGRTIRELAARPSIARDAAAMRRITSPG